MVYRRNRLLLLAFVVIIFAIVTIGNLYKKGRIEEYLTKQHDSIARSLANEVDTLIEEKSNATLGIALAVAQSDRIVKALRSTENPRALLERFSAELREYTDFKNVWIQMVDTSGISRARSWSDKLGDDLYAIREDVRSMIHHPKPRSSVSVGHFDMSFKSMVPIYDGDLFIGFLEVITHFNSIAEKIRDDGFEPLILVDKRYTQQLTRPFSKKFAGAYYVANKSADDALIAQIEKRGLESFLSTSRNYVIDAQEERIVVNYTLFDELKQPMAYFLMFRPLSDLGLDSVENLRLSANLLISLAILASAFGLYFIANKEHELPSIVQENIRAPWFAAAFMLTAALYYLLVQWYYADTRERYLDNHTTEVVQDYNMIRKQFKQFANGIFTAYIQRPEVLKLMAQAYEGDEAKTAAREALFKLLRDEYEYFKGYEIRQLHFHLRTNESFLRFHRPKKFGDNLTGIRDTVAWVNANHQPIDGFEEGRIFNGYRFVFPLDEELPNGDRRHLGSMEISFSAYAFAEEFVTTYDAKAGFLIKRDLVDKKVFKEESINYGQSEFPGFYYEKKVRQRLEHAFRHLDSSLIPAAEHAALLERSRRGSVYSFPGRDGYAVFTVIPIKNPISRGVSAVLILQDDDMVIANQRNQRLLVLATGIIALFFVMLYLYRESVQRRRYHNLLHKTQNILDSQNAIVIVSDGNSMLDCNRMLLDFFGFESLEAFKQAHECICDRFEPDERFFHLAKVTKGKSWIETMETMAPKERLVSMRSGLGATRAFAVSISRFDENYIVSFSDISDTVNERFSLQKRVGIDKLTGAFNREFFDQNIASMLQAASASSLELGIVMFDIDDFKHVNDTHGHAVGDQVLVELTHTVRDTIRRDDALIRWGGEEFLLIMKTRSAHELGRIVKQIQLHVAQNDFNEVGRVTCSFGVTLYAVGEPIEQAIARADAALYRAKAEGKNCVVVSDVHPI